MSAAGAVPGPPPEIGAPARREREIRRGRIRLGPQHPALAAILVLSGLLEFVKLSQNGFANTFYAAAVKSMLRSLHNFFFVSSD
ncbi:MAG: glycosyl transferase, partial [Solirubrobacteraceae bacterium]